MTVITIDTDNKTDLAKARAIAKENGWFIKETTTKVTKRNGKKVAALLNELSLKGGPKSFPDDASKWQKLERKDKKIVGR